jgi:hypothetical protein
LDDGLEQDEILGQIILEFGVFEELLTEQFAAPSGVGREVEEDFFVFGSGLSQGFVESALEEIALGKGRRSEKNNHRKS